MQTRLIKHNQNQKSRGGSVLPRLFVFGYQIEIKFSPSRKYA